MPRKKPWTWQQTIKLATMVFGLFFFSWINATHFDATEMKMIGEVAALGAIVFKFFPD